MRHRGPDVAVALLMLGATACVGPPEEQYARYRPAPPAPREEAPPVAPESEPFPTRSLDDEVTAIPAPRPAWQSRPVEPDAVRVEGQSHVVRPGEGLASIAERTGAGIGAIARANALEPPYALAAGQRLLIPGGRYHAVHAGDTGIGIARAYRVDWSRIVAANALAEPYILRTGQRILIPDDGGAPAARSPEERAAAFRIDIDDIITGGEPALASNARPVRPGGATRGYAPDMPIAPPASFAGSFAWPVRGSVVTRFGRGASGERNDGVKIAVPVGTPVRAAADGVVAYAGDEVAGLGGLIILKHGDSWTTVYGYLSRLLVQRGQSVRRGQSLALSGDSGFADRPELHFEIRRKRTPVDPQAQLPRSG